MRIQLIVLGYLCLLVIGFSDNLRGPLFSEIISDLKLSDTAGGWFFAISSLFSIMGSVSIRFLYNTKGIILSVRSSLVFVILGLLGIGIAKSLTVLLIASFLLGIGFGAISFLENILVTTGAGPKHPYLRQLLSGLHSMYGLSSFIAPAVVAILYGLNLKWNHIFLIATLAPISLLAYTFFLKTNELTISNNVSEKRNMREIFEGHQFLFSTLVTFYVLGEILISSRLALYTQRTTSSSVEYSSQMVMYFFMALFAGRILFTFYSWKFSNYLLLQISLLCSILFLIIGLLYSPVIMALSGFFMGPFFPTAITYAVEVFKEKSDSVIWLIVTMFSVLPVGLHLLVGVISDHWGISVAMWLSPIILIIAFILIIIERVVYQKRVGNFKNSF